MVHRDSHKADLNPRMRAVEYTVDNQLTIWFKSSQEHQDQHLESLNNTVSQLKTNPNMVYLLVKLLFMFNLRYKNSIVGKNALFQFSEEK